MAPTEPVDGEVNETIDGPHSVEVGQEEQARKEVRKALAITNGEDLTESAANPLPGLVHHASIERRIAYARMTR